MRFEYLFDPFRIVSDAKLATVAQDDSFHATRELNEEFSPEFQSAILQFARIARRTIFLPNVEFIETLSGSAE